MRIENPPRDLPTMVARRFEWSMGVPEAFFAREEQRIAEACCAMARRFQQGGRLLTFGHGAGTSDAQQMALEFGHPALVGRRALPALTLRNDGASFAEQLRVLARPQDIVLGIAPPEHCVSLVSTLLEARCLELLTLGLTGGEETQLLEHTPDFLFVVNTHDPLIIQETHETLYHLLWELVHLFFEDDGLVY